MTGGATGTGVGEVMAKGRSGKCGRGRNGRRIELKSGNLQVQICRKPQKNTRGDELNRGTSGSGAARRGGPAAEEFPRSISLEPHEDSKERPGRGACLPK